jgi:hypothetical protein
MLLNSFSHIALGFFDSLSIAIATWQAGAIGHIALVLGLFLNDEFKRIKFHNSPHSLFNAKTRHQERCRG